jgi:hypothetical protein
VDVSPGDYDLCEEEEEEDEDDSDCYDGGRGRGGFSDRMQEQVAVRDGLRLRYSQVINTLLTIIITTIIIVVIITTMRLLLCEKESVHKRSLISYRVCDQIEQGVAALSRLASRAHRQTLSLHAQTFRRLRLRFSRYFEDMMGGAALSVDLIACRVAKEVHSPQGAELPGGMGSARGDSHSDNDSDNDGVDGNQKAGREQEEGEALEGGFHFELIRHTSLADTHTGSIFMCLLLCLSKMAAILLSCRQTCA